MYEAAVVILSRVKKASGLEDWAQAIAKRSGTGKARVALARKLCTILHRIWRSGEPFRWSAQQWAADFGVYRHIRTICVGADESCPWGEGAGKLRGPVGRHDFV